MLDCKSIEKARHGISNKVASFLGILGSGFEEKSKQKKSEERKEEEEDHHMVLGIIIFFI